MIRWLTIAWIFAIRMLIYQDWIEWNVEENDTRKNREKETLMKICDYDFKDTCICVCLFHCLSPFSHWLYETNMQIPIWNDRGRLAPHHFVLFSFISPVFSISSGFYSVDLTPTKNESKKNLTQNFLMKTIPLDSHTTINMSLAANHTFIIMIHEYNNKILRKSILYNS